MVKPEESWSSSGFSFPYKQEGTSIEKFNLVIRFNYNLLSLYFSRLIENNII